MPCSLVQTRSGISAAQSVATMIAVGSVPALWSRRTVPLGGKEALPRVQHDRGAWVDRRWRSRRPARCLWLHQLPPSLGRHQRQLTGQHGDQLRSRVGVEGNRRPWNEGDASELKRLTRRGTGHATAQRLARNPGQGIGARRARHRRGRLRVPRGAAGTGKESDCDERRKYESTGRCRWNFSFDESTAVRSTTQRNALR